MSPEEMAKYGGKWIATKSKQVIAVADSLGKLYRHLDAQGLRPACISYIEDPSVESALWTSLLPSGAFRSPSLCASLKIMPPFSWVGKGSLSTFGSPSTEKPYLPPLSL